MRSPPMSSAAIPSCALPSITTFSSNTLPSFRRNSAALHGAIELPRGSPAQVAALTPSRVADSAICTLRMVMLVAPSMSMPRLLAPRMLAFSMTIVPSPPLIAVPPLATMSMPETVTFFASTMPLTTGCTFGSAPRRVCPSFSVITGCTDVPFSRTTSSARTTGTARRSARSGKSRVKSGPEKGRPRRAPQPPEKSHLIDGENEVIERDVPERPVSGAELQRAPVGLRIEGDDVRAAARVQHAACGRFAIAGRVEKPVRVRGGDQRRLVFRARERVARFECESERAALQRHAERSTRRRRVRAVDVVPRQERPIVAVVREVRGEGGRARYAVAAPEAVHGDAGEIAAERVREAAGADEAMRAIGEADRERARRTEAARHFGRESGSGDAECGGRAQNEKGAAANLKTRIRATGHWAVSPLSKTKDGARAGSRWVTRRRQRVGRCRRRKAGRLDQLRGGKIPCNAMMAVSTRNGIMLLCGWLPPAMPIICGANCTIC